ncbi:MAG: hypothetical protein AAB664_02385 [Patescibacteria group bacterium]
MTTKLLTSIPIPTKFLKRWQNQPVFVSGDDNVLIVKKIEKSDVNFLKRMKVVGRRLKKKDLKEAIVTART